MHFLLISRLIFYIDFKLDICIDFLYRCFAKSRRGEALKPVGLDALPKGRCRHCFYLASYDV